MRGVERLTKVEIRKYRLGILAEIDRLDGLRCDFCSNEAEGKSLVERSKCECDSAVEIRALGVKLNKLVTTRKKEAVELEVVVTPNPSGLTIKNVTVEMYGEFKREGLPDKDIWGLLGTSESSFKRWKSANGVSKKSGART